MKSLIFESTLNDLNEIAEIDRKIVGNDNRKKYIKRAIEEKRCVAIKDKSIVGFLIFDTHFFDCSFISLIIVKPTERRKGYATSLLEFFLKIAPTRKVFSSTNQSNKKMQQVFERNGFVRSGFIENLDNGDPEIIYFTSR